MDFEFSPQEIAWREEASQFFRNECPSEKVERLRIEQRCTNPYDHDLYMKIVKSGYAGITWPQQYGGRGLPKMFEAIFLEEMGYWQAPMGTWNVFVNTQNFLGNSLARQGTEEQKRRWLPRILSGEFRTSNGITEPDAGTDAANAQTTASEDGDSFIVNGTKIFNNAHRVDWITTVLRTDRNVPKHKGISVLLINLHSPGVTVKPTYVTLGGWERSEVNFSDVRVPKENLIGVLNRGWIYLMGYLQEERVSLSMVGKSVRAMNRLVDYLRVKDPDSLKSPGVRSALADIKCGIESSRLLAYWAVWKLGQGVDAGAEIGMCKVAIAEASGRMSNLCLEILGPAGQLTESCPSPEWLPLHGEFIEWYADIRVEQVAGGSSEVLRNQLAQRCLGLPRG